MTKKIMTPFLKFILLLCSLLLCGCMDQNGPAKYMKTFDHVLNDQYREIRGQGGIFWVSNEHVVLEARIENEEGLLDMALYQVDVRDGSYLKLVEISDNVPITYKYCFDGEVLHVMRSRGTFTKVSEPEGYRVVIRELVGLTHDNRYSSLRCGFVDIPKEKGEGYLPLKKQDGLIKNKALGGSEKKIEVFLTDDQGNNLKEVVGQRLDSRGLIGVRSFSEHENAYFGNTAFRKKCTYLTWLFREDWKVEQKELCMDGWSFGSVLVHRIEGSLFLEHYTKNSSKFYIWDDELEVLVDDGFGRGASVSQDGCRVAYGVGDRTRGKSGSRQRLKVFNYCEFKNRG